MSGRGKAKKTLAILAASIRILKEIQPASARGISYRLFTEGLMSSMAKSNTNMVSRLLVEARENGDIPWEWIVDETREAETIASWNNPTEIIEQACRQYRRNNWADQAQRIEVLSEKGTVRGIIAPVLNKYGVTFRVMHGYGSATALHDIAEESQSSEKPLTLLYVGDWDPSGLHMSEIDLPARLERYGATMSLVRIALTRQDIRRGKLPHFEVETKAKDPRFRWYLERFGRKCWELDALSPVVLRQRVEDEIVARLDVDVWNRAIEVQQAERKSMREILGRWPGISMPANK